VAEEAAAVEVGEDERRWVNGTKAEEVE